MIFADKLTHHRKKNGWTQEELAEKMFVSRQAVSKWESAQSIPDLDKIIQLSELFGVTTDYLLKDEYAPEDDGYLKPKMEAVDSVPPARRVSLEEATRYLDLRRQASKNIGLGVVLCIVGLVIMMLLSAAAHAGLIGLSEEAAGIIGLIAGAVLIAIAVGLFVITRQKNAAYRYIATDRIETAYGVDGMVKERQKDFKDTHLKYTVIGAILLVLSILPLITGAFYKGSLMTFYVTLMRSLSLLILAAGSYLLIRAGVVEKSFDRLLEEEHFAKKRRRSRRHVHPVIEALWNWYWIIVTCIYWTWSLLTFNWLTTWVVWPIALVLYPILSALLDD